MKLPTTVEEVQAHFSKELTVERFRMECLEKKPLSKKEMRVTA
jgi:hypothetical protein